MAKKLNKKVAIIGIVIATLVVLGAGAAAFRHFYQRDPERNLNIARQAIAEGDYKRAEGALGKAYAYGKTDAYKIERLFELADFHLIQNEQHEANWTKALRCWNTVLNIAPKNVPARQKMMQYFYDMADSGQTAVWKNVYDNAKELIEITKANGGETDAKLLEAFGRAALSIAWQGSATNRKDYLDEAQSSFETLIQRQPTVVSYYSYLADVIVVQGELNEQAGVIKARDTAQQAALKKLDEAVENADDKAEAQATRYAFDLQLAGNDPNKIEALRAAIERSVKAAAPNAKLQMVLSQAYEIPGNGDAKAELNRAIETARQASELAPEEFEYRYRLAMLLYRKGSAFQDVAAIEDAVALAEEMKKMPQAQDIPSPQRGRNLAYRNAVNVFLAGYYLEQAFLLPEQAETWAAKAEPLVAQIKEYFGSSENITVQQWEGMLALAKGKRDIAVRMLYRAYEQAKALDVPEQPSAIDPVLCVTLARIAQQDNQVGLQREFLEKALSNRTRMVLNKPSLILDYAEMMLRFRSWEQAASLASVYQQRYGGNERSGVILTQAALALGDAQSVQRAIASLPEKSPERLLLELNFVSSQIAQIGRQAERLENEGKKPSADATQKLETLRSRQRQLLLAAIEAAPEKIDVSLLYSACVYDLRNKKKADAVALLDDYLARIPNALVLKVLRRQADEPEPLAVPAERYAVLQAEAIESLSDLKQRAMAGAGIFRARGEYDKALELLAQAAQADTDNDTDVIQQQFDIAVEREDIKSAETLLPVLRSRNMDGCEGNLASAQVLMLKKDYPQALRRVDEALAIKPLASFGYYLKSRIYQLMDNLDAAAKESRQAIQMDPLDSRYAKNQASILFNRNTALGARVTPAQQTELVQAITIAMALNPNDWQLQSVYAAAISGQAPDQALAIRQQILDNYPSVGNAVLLGNLALRMAQTEQDPAKKTGLIELSGKAYTQALQIEPNHEDAKAAYANYLRQTSQSEKAEELLRDDKNLLWRYYLQNSQFDKAEELLTQLYQADAKDSTVLRGLVLTAEGKGNRTDIKQYLDLLSALELDKDNELWLLQKYLDGGFAEEVDKRLASFKERYPDEKVVLLLEAWAKMTNGLLDDALKLTNRYLESNDENAGAWRLRGRLNRLMNDPRKAVEDLQRSKNLSPDPTVSLELATVYGEMGQTDAAIGELVNGLKSPQAPLQMRAMLESLYQQNNRTGDLEQFYAQTFEKFPDAPFWGLRAGQYYLSQKDAAKAVFYLKKAWDSLQRQNASDPAALNLLLEAMVQNRQYDEVLTLASGWVDGPLAPIAYTQMAQSQFKQGQKDKAESLFFTALDKSGGIDMFQEMVLSMMLKTVGQESAVRWAQKNPDSIASLLLSYRLALVNQEYNRGIELVDKCLVGIDSTTPEWSDLALKKGNLLVQAYAKTSDKTYMTRAIDLFGQVLERYPESASLLNNLAYMLAANDQRIEQALQYARRAHQKEPGNPIYLDTYAYVQYKAGQAEQARQNLLRAVQLYEVSRQPVPWDVYNHLGLVQEKIGQAAKAIDAYRKAMEATPKAPEKDQKELQERIDKLTQKVNTPS